MDRVRISQNHRCAGCPFSKRSGIDATTTFPAGDILAWVEGIDEGAPAWACHAKNDGSLCAGACGIPSGLERQTLGALTARWGI